MTNIIKVGIHRPALALVRQNTNLQKVYNKHQCNDLDEVIVIEIYKIQAILGSIGQEAI